jgi:hypothetical protein
MQGSLLWVPHTFQLFRRQTSCLMRTPESCPVVEFGQSRVSFAEINAWSCTSISPYVFVALCLIKNREDITFHFYFRLPIPHCMKSRKAVNAGRRDVISPLCLYFERCIEGTRLHLLRLILYTFDINTCACPIISACATVLVESSHLVY